MFRVNKQQRDQANRAFFSIGQEYHDIGWWEKIELVLAKVLLVPLQEDYTRWQGFFTGRQTTKL